MHSSIRFSERHLSSQVCHLRSSLWAPGCCQSERIGSRFSLKLDVTKRQEVHWEVLCYFSERWPDSSEMRSSLWALGCYQTKSIDIWNRCKITKRQDKRCIQAWGSVNAEVCHPKCMKCVIWDRDSGDVTHFADPWRIWGLTSSSTLISFTM